MSGKIKAGIGAYLATPIMHVVVMTLASLAAIYGLGLRGEQSPVPVFVFFAVVDAACMLLYAVLPQRFKNAARLTAMFIIGSTLLLLAGILGKQNFQAEGFWFFALAGAFGGVIIHFTVGKIAGPVFTGRSWCSWGCWTAMILDLLPYKESRGWVKGKAGYRVVHFALGTAVVAILVFGFHYTMHTPDHAGRALYWFLLGNAAYYAAAIALAVIMKDNRAFCKYLCPVTVFLKAGTAVSLLRIKGRKEICAQCGDCAKTCPMNIDIPGFVQQGSRVASTECILCMKCVSVCKTASLSASVGLDVATRDKVKVME